MEEKAIRAAILRCFDAHREKPGEKFDEENFLGFLMAGGEGLQDVRNGFAGLKRLNAFYDDIQLECAVCLEANDADRNWSVQKLAERIASRKKNRSSQITLAKNRVEAAKGMLLFEPLKFGIFIILPAIFILWNFIGGWITGGVLFAIGFGVAFMIWRQQKKDLDYYKRLLEEIQSAKP